jgi:hypothetical protein
MVTLRVGLAVHLCHTQCHAGDRHRNVISGSFGIVQGILDLTAAAMSMECTTSANSTVACLYSAGVLGTAVGVPHSSQNFALGRNSALHLTQLNTAVMRLTIRRSPMTGGAIRWHPWLDGHAVGQAARSLVLIDAAT